MNHQRVTMLPKRIHGTISNHSRWLCVLFSFLVHLAVLVTPIRGQEAATTQPVYYANFYNTRELVSAVDVYLTQDTTSSDYVTMLEKYGPIEGWKTQRIFDFSNLFNAKLNPIMENLNIDLSQWDVSNAESFVDMFLGCKGINFDVSNWNVGKATRFNGMFHGAENFQGQGLSNWNVQNGKYFEYMFEDTASLDMSIVDLRNWNVRNALTMQRMFNNSTFGLPPTSSSSPTTNDLCSWNDRLYPSVVTTDMFLDSACSDPTDPDLKNRATTQISLCVPCGEPSTTQTQRRPNVLFIMTDQQRFDTIRYVQDTLSQYDNYVKINTPNLDKLLQSGAYFETAYTECAVCAPARTSLRTGCTIERTGIQHNDLIYEYVDSTFFTRRVEALEGLDDVLVEQYGYISEYYGKWHMPDSLYYNKDTSSEPRHNVIHYNDYSYKLGEFDFNLDSDGSKLQQYLGHCEDDLGLIDRTLQDGQQYDTYTGFPYTPIQLDSRARHQSPTGTPLTTSRGFEIYEITQPNVVGRYALDDDYTPSHFTGAIAVNALERMLNQSDPWLLTVSFHNPHPPMVPAWGHLEYYWDNRASLFVSPSIDDTNENTAYDSIRDILPDYSDPTKVREWTALYYALIEEIDDYVGQLLDTLEADNDAYANTLVLFTSDHGEMLGAHGKREKNNFYEESSRVPLFLSWPGKINAGTVVKEMVSHLDVFATILDYVGASESDNSDGSSLRPLIEGREINQLYDEDVVCAEWDFRLPLPGYDGLPVTPTSGSSTTTTTTTGTATATADGGGDASELEDGALERAIDDRPTFLVRKGSYKLMMQKLASSEKLDMMFNLDNDPYEINNLVGYNGMNATTDTILKAEYLRCLLLGWLGRMDGDQGYFSDPAANFGQGLGDINEVRNRQSWWPIGFWTSASSSSGSNVLEFGRVAWTGTTFVRHEHLFMGTRLNETIVVSSIAVTGSNAALFSVDRTSLEFGAQACESVRVTFTSPSTLSSTPVDASLVLQLGDGSSVTIVLTMSDYNFESQILNYPPPPTLSPTMTMSPSVGTGEPSKSPSVIPTTATPIASPTGSPSQFNDTDSSVSIDSNNETDSEGVSGDDDDDSPSSPEDPATGAPDTPLAVPSTSPITPPAAVPIATPTTQPISVPGTSTQASPAGSSALSLSRPATAIFVAVLTVTNAAFFV